MKPLRVAFLIPVFPELHNTFILNQMTGLIDRGVDLHLYPLAVGSYESAHAEVHEYRLRERDKHVPVPEPHLQRVLGAAARLLEPRHWNPAVFDALNPLRGKEVWSLVPAYTALSFAANDDYDIVHAQFGHLSPLAERLLSRSGSKARLVTSFRGADTTSHLPRNPAAYAPVFANGALFMPVSEDLRARLIAVGSPPDRTVVHRSGVDLRRFEFTPRRLAAGETTELLFVGRFVEKKGIRDALAAFAKALQKLGGSEPAPRGANAGGEPAPGGANAGGEPSLRPPTFDGVTAPARLTLVGGGPLEAEMKRLVADLGLTGAVRFAGSLDADGVAGAMRSSHVLLAPSVTAASGDKEGVPNVIKEAMASGMPVLSTVHGGIPELVDDGVSGYLVAEHDVDALAGRLVELVRAPQTWAELGAAGRSKVEAEFDSEKLNDLLLERYLSVLG